MLVETTPGAPPQEWSIEWGSPNQLSRQGIRPSTFKFGTKVTVRVRPMRDGSPAGGFVGAKFDDGKTVGRWEVDLSLLRPSGAFAERSTRVSHGRRTTPTLTLSRRALLARAAAVGAGAVIPLDLLRHGRWAEAAAQGARVRGLRSARCGRVRPHAGRGRHARGHLRAA